MKIGNREFDVKNKTYIMGILNVTGFFLRWRKMERYGSCPETYRSYDRRRC